MLSRLRRMVWSNMLDFVKLSSFHAFIFIPSFFLRGSLVIWNHDQELKYPKKWQFFVLVSHTNTIPFPNKNMQEYILIQYLSRQPNEEPFVLRILRPWSSHQFCPSLISSLAGENLRLMQLHEEQVLTSPFLATAGDWELKMPTWKNKMKLAIGAKTTRQMTNK